MKIIAIFYNNGGVGRTTTTVNISACLAEEKGEEAYAVDLDNAAFLSDALNVQGGSYIGDILREVRKVRKEDFGTTPTSKFFVLKNRRNEINDELFQNFIHTLTKYKADRDKGVIEFDEEKDEILRDLEEASKDKDGNVKALDKTLILKVLFNKLEGDFLLFDCPQYYELPTLNVLRCADYLLCPLEMTPKGLGTLESILQVHKQTVLVNPNLKLLGFFASKAKMHLRRFKIMIPALKKQLGNLFFNATISENESIINSQRNDEKKTIFEYGDIKAIQEYINLTNEMLLKMQ